MQAQGEITHDKTSNLSTRDDIKTQYVWRSIILFSINLTITFISGGTLREPNRSRCIVTIGVSHNRYKNDFVVMTVGRYPLLSVK